MSANLYAPPSALAIMMKRSGGKMERKQASRVRVRTRQSSPELLYRDTNSRDTHEFIICGCARLSFLHCYLPTCSAFKLPRFVSLGNSSVRMHYCSNHCSDAFDSCNRLCIVQSFYSKLVLLLNNYHRPRLNLQRSGSQIGL
jgi:hypothetical protein